MTGFSVEMCAICFAPKRFDSDELVIISLETSEPQLSELGFNYQELIHETLNVSEARPRFLCKYCKEQLVTYQIFRAKAQAAYRKVSEDLYTEGISSESSQTDGLTKVEEITVYDIATKKTEKFEIQYLDDEATRAADDDKEPSISFSKACTEGENNVPSNPNIIYCRLCAMAFTSDDAFKIHWKEHVKVSQYSCEKCPQKFHSEVDYHNHLEVHNNTNNFSCDICGRVFHRVAHLNVHMKTHTDERPFECVLCRKRFKSNSHLKYHLYTHSGKQFLCELCNQRYSTPRTLNEHLRYVHKREFPFTCDVCQKQFTRRFKMERHRVTHFPA